MSGDLKQEKMKQFAEENNLENKSLSRSLVNYNWQLAMVEREKNKDTIHKLDKVEVVMQFNSDDGGDIKQNLLKMNYYEFNEIYQNLKKIDSQLHLFKN
jgi:hypothetical protein